MEILQLIFDVIPMFFVLGYAVAATLTKSDIKEIKYLMWAALFMLATIADSVING